MKGRIARPEAQKPRLILPRVGKVKIGMKGAGGYPQSVDYFIHRHTAKSPKQYKLFSRTTTPPKYVANNTNTGTTPGD